MPPPKAEFYIPSLDGLRAVSILVVFASHVGFGDVVPGGFGVTVFFFLSGYLITTLLRREYERTESISIRSFYWRRFWRILPPMYLWLAVAVVLALLGLTEPMPEPLAVLGQVAHLSNYVAIADVGRLAPGTWPMWSLAVEEHFYLGFPFLFLLLLRRFDRRGQAIVLASLCAAVLAWRIVLVAALDVSELYTNTATDSRIDSILFGCFLAVAANPYTDDVPRFSARTRYASVGLAVAALLATFVLRQPMLRETVRYSIQGLALIPIFYFAVLDHDDVLFRPLNWGWVRFLGVLSYSFYLIHFIVVFALYRLDETLLGPKMFVLAGAITLALSYGSYRLVELPAKQLGRRLRG